MADRLLRQATHDALAEAPLAGARDRDDAVRVREVDVIGVHPTLARADVRFVPADLGHRRTRRDATGDLARAVVVGAAPGPEPRVPEDARSKSDDVHDGQVVGR